MEKMEKIEKIEKIKITNAKQFEKLVEELQKNPSLARGFCRGTVPSNFIQQWDEVAKVLNSLGPPRRLGDGWQKVWRDFKFKVKKKIVANKVECNATGGGRFKQFTLSPLEEDVANLLQFQKQLNPQGATQGVQCDNQGNEIEVPEIDLALNMEEISDTVELCAMDLPIDQELPESSSRRTIQHSKPVSISLRKESSTPLKSKESCTKENKCNCNGRQKLLQNHSDEQARLLTDISNTLTSIKRILRDENSYKKQLLDIEKKKLKLLEEKNKRDAERNQREKENHENELKLKRIKMLIKEKELELLNKK